MADEQLRFDTVSEQIAQRLRQEIIRGQYLPGERLNQMALGRRFQVSRMPVRDALHTLEAEGLVTLHPHHGARIAAIDLKRSKKIYQIREVLEVWALEQSIPLMTAQHLTRIRKHSRELGAIQGAKDVSAWLEVDRTFHHAMYAPLDNEELLEIIVELWNATQQLRRAYCLLPGALAKAFAHHVELMGAIEARDAARAGAIEREHIRQTLRAVSAHLETDTERGEYDVNARADFAEQVILVTGASRGIGLAVAAEFAGRGASVYLNSRSLERAEAACRSLEDRGLRRCHPVAADVAQRDQVERMVADVMARNGRIDVLVNNAGIPSRHGLFAIDDSHWQRVLDVNLTGVFLCTQMVARHMVDAGQGRIVNTSSFAATFSGIERGAYSASKAGVEALTKVWAGELAPHGIAVNAVAPGDIDTDIIADLRGAAEQRLFDRIAMRRLGQPEEVASVVAFLASPGASYLTGIVVNISGGKLVVQNPSEAWARPRDAGDT